MIKRNGRIQGQHVLGAGFLASLLGVLFNLSSSKVNNYLPQFADAAAVYANNAFIDPYGYVNNSGYSSYGHQNYSLGYGDNYGYSQQPYTSQAGYNSSLGGRFQNANYTGGSGFPNLGPSHYGNGHSGYQNAGYNTNGLLNTGYSNAVYQNGYQSGYQNGHQSGYQNGHLSGYQGNSGYLNNNYSGTNYLNYGDSNSGYSQHGWGASSSYLNNGQLNNGPLSRTVSYANQLGYPNSYSGLNNYNTTGYHSAEYGSSGLGRYQNYRPIRVYFSPNGGCTDAIIRELQQAQRQIFMQAYSFTSEPIAMALISALRRGVQVVVILDKSQMSEPKSVAEYLATSGVTTMIDSTHQIAHNKVILVDGRTIITGSFNFTYNAEHSNAENLLVINDNADLYAAYDANFRKCYNQSSVYASRTSNRSAWGYR